VRRDGGSEDQEEAEGEKEEQTTELSGTLDEAMQNTHRWRATTTASVTAKRHSAVVVTFGLALLAESAGASCTAPYAVSESRGRVRWYLRCLGKYIRYSTRLHMSSPRHSARGSHDGEKQPLQRDLVETEQGLETSTSNLFVSLEMIDAKRN